MNIKEFRVVLSLALLCGLQQVSRAIPVPIAIAIADSQQRNNESGRFMNRADMHNAFSIEEKRLRDALGDDAQLRIKYLISRAELDAIMQVVIQWRNEWIKQVMKEAASAGASSDKNIDEALAEHKRLFRQKLEEARINAIAGIPDKNKASDTSWGEWVQTVTVHWFRRSK